VQRSWCSNAFGEFESACNDDGGQSKFLTLTAAKV
jgi:hypothetical protein